MNRPIPNLNYPDNEKAALIRLGSLFEEWKINMVKSLTKFEDYTANDFVFDGFHPYYFSQKIRVVFVGRESRGLSGHNYIEVLNNSYRDNKLGKRPLNQSKFHRLMLYVAYSLNNGFCGWENIPYADKIGETFSQPKGVSFAFMNLSKFSNERTSWQMISELINCSVAASHGDRNFLKEQIEILSPHVVVTMNLGDRISLLGDVELLGNHPHVDAYRVQFGSQTGLLLNTFHFSAFGKKDQAHFVDPIRSLVEQYHQVAGF